MTIVALDAHGLALADARLAAGEPIVIPTPSPLAYVLLAEAPAPVNLAKGRPADQAAGVVFATPDDLRAVLALEGEAGELATWLCFTEHVSVLMPAPPDPPSWLAPAIRDGLAFVAAAWLPALTPLLAGRPHLYSSSANRTTGLPATSAAEADAAFAGELLVLDGDPLRDAGRAHASTTSVEVTRDGGLAVRRPGIQDATFGGDPDDYLADVRARFDRR